MDKPISSLASGSKRRAISALSKSSTDRSTVLVSVPAGKPVSCLRPGPVAILRLPPQTCAACEAGLA